MAGPSATETVTTTASVTVTCTKRDLAFGPNGSVDLTGTWEGDDGAIHYIRQLGHQVWWAGLSGLGGAADNGSDFFNVYHGTMTGQRITGAYVDLPTGGSLFDDPHLAWTVRAVHGRVVITKAKSSAKSLFEGAVLTPCNEVR
ncbi:MAG: hypothetical protein WKF54_06005 [Nocardioidaceae bacterium]